MPIAFRSAMMPAHGAWFGLQMLLQVGAMQLPGDPPPGWEDPPETIWDAQAPAETPPTSPPQDPPEAADSSRSRWLLGTYGAVFVPIGAWADHPYAGRTLGSVSYDEDLDQFGPGFGLGVELGWKSRGAVMLTLQVEGTTLATGEWEAEAAKQGSRLSSHAAQLSAMLMLSAELFESRRWRMDARFGLGVMEAWGGEELRDPDVSYDYSFLKTSFAARAGLGSGYRISSSVDLTLLVDFVWAVPGVAYVDRSLPYLGVAALLGPRFWFGARSGGSRSAS